jgi:uncharacterized protein (TIGR03437 family)
MEFKISVVAVKAGTNVTTKSLFAVAVLLAFSGSVCGATFGTVVTIPGHMADIALDQTRGLVYAANFTASRIEVVSMGSQSLQNPIIVANQPSSLAVSPDGHYLVIGHYATPNAPSAALTIIDLNTSNGARRTLTLGSASVLAVAFGNGSNALIVHTNGVSLLDPATATLKTLNPGPFAGTALPVSWATFPPQIIQASAGVSGNGSVIYALLNVGTNPSQIVRYDVNTGDLLVGAVTASPPLGPVVMSVDQTGATFLAGWALSNPSLVALAQFPYLKGALNVGGHAFDWSRNLIYAQIPLSTGQTGPPLLSIVDSDNLTVRETFQLRENLAGKALLNGDTMYALSDSGVTIFPTGSLASVHRIQAVQEDLLFQASGCNQTVVSQYLDIVDPSGGATDFTLKVNSPGVRFSASSGTTPARIQVLVDPTSFQNQKGTVAVQVQITSAQALNVPAPVRLLINTRDADQQGVIYNVPGKIVDVLADPARNRFYMVRQDRNQVLVFDSTSYTQIATLRTGNTPVQMAIFRDDLGAWLLVTNDNSQIISVFDLNSLKPANPVVLPPGLYARSIASSSSYNRILATTRDGLLASGPVVRINMAFGIANAPPALGIYSNSVVLNSALVASPSERMIFMPMPDGTVALYDSQADAFISSRKDLTALSGAYGALSDGLFLAGNHIFNSAMVGVGEVDLLGGESSGVAAVDGLGLITSAAGNAGTIQRFSMDQFNSISPVRTSEDPSIKANLTSTPVDQTGQTILSFMRTLAPLNQQSFVQLSTSGFIVIPWTFDAALQTPVVSAITNAADGGVGVAPGGLITIWGSNLSSGIAQAGQVPLPKGLGDVCLYANSLALPLLFVSPNQINAQLPFNTPATASISINNSRGQSAPFNFAVQPIAPAIFLTGTGGALIIRTVDGQLITDQTPIHLNEILNIWMTGLGAVNTPVTTGDASPFNPLAATITTPTITIGGASIFTLWSGLAPGMVGVYQVNAQVPFHHIPTGSNIPFTVSMGGTSVTVKLRVEE